MLQYKCHIHVYYPVCDGGLITDPPIQAEFKTGSEVAITSSSYRKVFDVYWTVHHCDN
jgi:hypothetical protein